MTVVFFKIHTRCFSSLILIDIYSPKGIPMPFKRYWCPKCRTQVNVGEIGITHDNLEGREFCWRNPNPIPEV
jgi:hypothetical protein